MKLRAYQEDAVRALRLGYRASHKRQVLGLPTGSGKTVIVSHMIKQAASKGVKALFIVDRIALVNQGRAHLERVGLKVGVMQGNNTDWSSDDDVVVASIQTINARKPPPADFVVIDEVHLLHTAHKTLIEAWPEVPFIGLSATPLNADLAKHFTRLEAGITIQELTAQRFLVPAKAYCPAIETVTAAIMGFGISKGDFRAADLDTLSTSNVLYGDIVDTWQRLASDRLTVCFAINVKHSKSIADNFKSQGIAAAHIDGYTPQTEREHILQRFKAGEIRVLSSVNVLSIGFDMPEISCAIIARPTLSEALHFQQLGRVVRPAPGKQDALILDHAGNTVRFGLPVDFVLPASLEDNTARPKPSTLKRQRRRITCPECGQVMAPAPVCEGCGYELPIQLRQCRYVDGVLVEYGAGDSRPIHEYSTEEKKHWYLAFKYYGLQQGYKLGWCANVYKDKFKVWPHSAWKALQAVAPTESQSQWIGAHISRWRGRSRRSQRRSV